jgi:hypothetical protein
VKRIITVTFFVALTFMFFSAPNSWALRCGSDLVSDGDSKAQVLVTCGKPTSKETSCENKREYTTTTKSGKIKKHRKCDRKLETWHYNCGSGDFIYKLTFENGKLRQEDTEGRGKGKSDCLGK